MPATPKIIKELVDVELSALHDTRVVSHIRGLLVEPVVTLREWDYGTTNQTYPCWAVLNHPKSNTGIAYCEFGFGPKTPWGLIWLQGSSNMSIGMDSDWFGSFTTAYFESQASTDLPIWRVFKQEDDSYPGTALTEESDWDSTWKEIERLRSVNPGTRYNCDHTIARVKRNFH